jgi:hypothetical protein
MDEQPRSFKIEELMSDCTQWVDLKYSFLVCGLPDIGDGVLRPGRIFAADSLIYAGL